MKCPVFEISLLIDLMLVKAGLQRDYSGLRDLSEKIQEKLELGNRSQTQLEYTYRIDNNKIPTALSKYEDEIKISDEYLQEYLNFLNFEDYQTFREQYLHVKAQLDKLQLKHNIFNFLLPRSKKHPLKEAIEDSFYPGQELAYHVTDFDGEKEWEEQLMNKMEKQLPICFVPPAFFKSNSLKLFLKSEKANHIVLIWLAERISELEFFNDVIDAEKELRFHNNSDDLCFLVQLLYSIELWYSREEKKKKKTKSYKKTVIKNEVGHNQGFVIGQLNSKNAPHIENHYYGKQKQEDED
ncbi:MAG: hypothetical protein RIC95_13955 [Vicingaceae bacterium]